MRNRMRSCWNKFERRGAFITMADPIAVELAAIAPLRVVVLECEHAA